MAFAFISPEAFKGDYTRSLNNFKSQGIESFDLKVDGKSLSGYPLTLTGNQYLSFYYKFLKECNFYNNNYSSGALSYDAFQDYNFMIVENLRRKKLFNGQLTLKLKFKHILNHKLYLIIMPVHKKVLNFDEYYQPEVVESSNARDDIYE